MVDETELTSQQIERLKNLRTQLPNALVTLYIHERLVGIKFLIDPNGYTIKYDYDECNRLKRIKDNDNNIIEEYSYGYKN